MPFNNLSPRLQNIAASTLAYCKNRYGGNGLKIEQGIHNSINWRPTFFLKPEKFRIIAFEVEDNLYPEALKGAAFEIGHFDIPISVYQVCSLWAYQNDPKQSKIKLLYKHGFGIITVDDDSCVTIQHLSIPLLQHISIDQFNTLIGTAELLGSIKTAFKDAYDVYAAKGSQGLQQAGQIVEGLVKCIAKQASEKGIITKSAEDKPLANVIDNLYETKDFEHYRAALASARDFIKEYRNPVSHPPKNAKEAADKIRKCKTGFQDAINVCGKLQSVIKNVGYKTTIYT